MGLDVVVEDRSLIIMGTIDNARVHDIYTSFCEHYNVGMSRQRAFLVSRRIYDELQEYGCSKDAPEPGVRFIAERSGKKYSFSMFKEGYSPDLEALARRL
jgi:hypothetical protein